MNGRKREAVGLNDVVAVPLAFGGFFLVDASDASNVMCHDWCLTNGYPSRRVGGEVVYLHRVLLPPATGMEVDHINRNPCDCRKSNLRVATRQQQAWNMSPSRDGCRGVYFDSRPSRRSRPWIARIRANNNQRWIGSFSTEEEAGHAVDRESRRLRGEFGYLNFADPANQATY